MNASPTNQNNVLYLIFLCLNTIILFISFGYDCYKWSIKLIIILTITKNNNKMTKEPEEKVKCIEQYSYSQVDRIGKGFSSTVFKGKDRNN